jgi:protein phosphatase
VTASAGVSEAGPVRSNNEDCFLVDDRLGLYIVADGMGGHAAGEIASRLAVDTIGEFLRRAARVLEEERPSRFDPAMSVSANRLRGAVETANRSIWQAAARHAPYSGMGTTVVCALLCGGALTVAHAGDSRLYVLAEGTLTAATRDDTWAAAFPGGGGRCASDHPFRHVLTNVLGGGEQATVHLSERPLAGGETLLLCTDGVHNVLDDSVLAEILSRRSSIGTIARAVVSTAIERGSRDNATAVVVRYTADGPQAIGVGRRGSIGG